MLRNSRGNVWYGKMTLAVFIEPNDAWIMWSVAEAMMIKQTESIETIIDNA